LFLASKIAHLNYLRAVESWGGRADTRLITLFGSENIPEFHMDHRLITEDAALALSRVLPAHDETEVLSLSNASLNDTSVKPISEVLEKLNLKALNLSKNKIGRGGCEELAKGIAANSSLTDLNLEDNLIDDVALNTLAANIAQKPLLSVLNLNGNHIGPEGAAALVQHLSNPERGPLPHLNLARNRLGDAGAIQLAAFLKANTTLKEVNLSGNEIGDEGAKAVAQALTRSSVVRIDLSHNNIGAAGALAVEQLLQHNSSVVTVDLSHNKRLVGDPSIASLLGEGFNFPLLSLCRDAP